MPLGSLRTASSRAKDQLSLASDGCAYKRRSGATPTRADPRSVNPSTYIFETRHSMEDASRKPRAAAGTSAACSRAYPGVGPTLPALGVIRRARFIVGCPQVPMNGRGSIWIA